METRVYVVETYDLDIDFIDVLLKDQEVFMQESEKQGHVYTLDGFEWNYNNGYIDALSYVKIITNS